MRFAHVRAMFVGVALLITFGLVGCGGSSSGTSGSGGQTTSATVQGQVVDSSGDPVEDAQITVQSTGQTSDAEQFGAQFAAQNGAGYSKQASQYAKRREQAVASGRSYQAAATPELSVTTRTDSEGYFAVDDLELDVGFDYVIKWDTDGAVGSDQRVTVAEGDEVISIGEAQTLDATDTDVTNLDQGDSVQIQAGTGSETTTDMQIDFPANALGESVNSADLEVFGGDPNGSDTDGRQFPGSYLASSPGSGAPDTGIESLGYLDAELTDNSGNIIRNLDTAALVRMEIPEQLPPDIAKNVEVGGTIPWWSYDENQGIWVKEDAFPDSPVDAARVVKHNGDTMMEARVRHFSSWNFDVPVDKPAAFKVSFKNQDGEITEVDRVDWTSGGVNYANWSWGNTRNTEEVIMPVERSRSDTDKRLSMLALNSVTVSNSSSSWSDQDVPLKVASSYDSGDQIPNISDNSGEDVKIERFDKMSEAKFFGIYGRTGETTAVLRNPKIAADTRTGVFRGSELNQEENVVHLDTDAAWFPVRNDDSAVDLEARLVLDGTDTPITRQAVRSSNTVEFTDNNGEFEITFPEPGTYTLFSANGWSDTFVVENDTDVGNIELTALNPTITSFSGPPSAGLQPGDQLEFGVEARDPNPVDGNLTYGWSVSSPTGSDTGTSITGDNNASWTIPSEDQLALFDNHSWEFEVTVTNPSGKKATRGVRRNLPASLVSITGVDQTNLQPGDQVDLTAEIERGQCSLADVTCSWAESSGDTSNFQSDDPSGESATWVAPSLFQSGTVKLVLTVEDQEGNTATDEIEISTESLNATIEDPSKTELVAGDDSVDLVADLGTTDCTASGITCSWAESDGDTRNFKNGVTTGDQVTWGAPSVESQFDVVLTVDDQSGATFEDTVTLSTFFTADDLTKALSSFGAGKLVQAREEFQSILNNDPGNAEAELGLAVSKAGAEFLENPQLRDFANKTVDAYSGKSVLGSPFRVTGDSIPAVDELTKDTFWQQVSDTDGTTSTASIGANYASAQLSKSSEIIAQAADPSSAGYDTSVTRLQDILANIGSDTLAEVSNSLQTAIDNNAELTVLYKHTPDPYDHLRDNAQEDDVAFVIEKEDILIAKSFIEAMRGSIQFIAAHDLEFGDLTDTQLESRVGTDPTVQEVLNEFPDAGTYRDATRLQTMSNRMVDGLKSVKSLYNMEIDARNNNGDTVEYFNDELDTELVDVRNAVDTSIRILENNLGYEDVFDVDGLMAQMDVDLDNTDETLEPMNEFFNDPPSLRDLLYRESPLDGELQFFMQSPALSFLTQNDSINYGRVNKAANVKKLIETEINLFSDSETRSSNVGGANIEFTSTIPGDTLTAQVTTISSTAISMDLHPIQSRVLSTVDKVNNMAAVDTVTYNWNHEALADFNLEELSSDSSFQRPDPLLVGYSITFNDTGQFGSFEITDTTPYFYGAFKISPQTRDVTNPQLNVTQFVNVRPNSAQFPGRDDLQFGDYTIYRVERGDTQNPSSTPGTLESALNNNFPDAYDGNDLDTALEKMRQQLRKGESAYSDFNFVDVTFDVVSETSPASQTGSFDLSSVNTADRETFVTAVQPNRWAYFEVPISEPGEPEDWQEANLTVGGYNDNSPLMWLSGITGPEILSGTTDSMPGMPGLLVEDYEISGNLTIER